MKKFVVLTLAAAALATSAVPAAAAKPPAPQAVIVDGHSDVLIRVPRSTRAALACVKNKTNTWTAGKGDCQPFGVASFDRRRAQWRASEDGHYQAEWYGRRIAKGQSLVILILGGAYGDGHFYTVRVKGVAS